MAILTEVPAAPVRMAEAEHARWHSRLGGQVILPFGFAALATKSRQNALRPGGISAERKADEPALDAYRAQYELARLKRRASNQTRRSVRSKTCRGRR